MSRPTNIEELARDRVLDAVADLEHDLMGCCEALEDLGLEEYDEEELANALSKEYGAIRNWLTLHWPGDE